MIDIHTHVLPKIDDGPSSWEETMAMVKQAEDEGIRELAITHHILSNQTYEREAEIITKFKELKSRIAKAKLKLKIHLGAELYAQVDMELNHQISTYNNNKKYFLVEFPMQGIPKFVADRFFELILNGMVPIIAHPERNGGIIRVPDRAFEFVQRGALLQMNAGSVLGRYGSQVKNTALKLLNSNLIHFVGSDAHNTTSRSFKFRSAFDAIVKDWGEDRAQLLFLENPGRAIAGEIIVPPDPTPIEALKNKSLLNPIALIKNLFE